jgi:hypothetical protein
MLDTIWAEYLLLLNSMNIPTAEQIDRRNHELFRYVLNFIAEYYSALSIES